MATKNRRAGIIFFKVGGTQYDAKGSFSYNLGAHQREGIVGSDGIHGFRETPRVPFIEGEITDREALNLRGLLDVEDTTVTLELGNQKVIVLRNAWFAGEGTGQTEEGNIGVRFEGLSAEEIR